MVLGMDIDGFIFVGGPGWNTDRRIYCMKEMEGARMDDMIIGNGRLDFQDWANFNKQMQQCPLDPRRTASRKRRYEDVRLR